jgi:hypothetical protein
MSKGNITTQIRCDVCGHEWFGCNDMRVNIVKARKWVQHNNGFTTRRVNRKLIDVCQRCSEKEARR